MDLCPRWKQSADLRRTTSSFHHPKADVRGRSRVRTGTVAPPPELETIVSGVPSRDGSRVGKQVRRSAAGCCCRTSIEGGEDHGGGKRAARGTCNAHARANQSARGSSDSERGRASRDAATGDCRSRRAPGGARKSQIPKPKSQDPTAVSLKRARWNLGFGIWDLGFTPVSAQPLAPRCGDRGRCAGR